ncbi:MAG: 3-phosphoshikimate 1-carboxyvinyltransferase [Clostridia bacterium]|nr:3-phosphoshikimate 1-carboxyvinyltransferase [Clostridia bacterium]
MRAIFKPSQLKGTISAPPSKSMAHRYLIGAALSGKTCTLSGIDYSEDILASIDCLKALGANITIEADTVTLKPQNFMTAKSAVLDCRESGSTLRFLIPLALCMGEKVVFKGSERLFERPLGIYEELCREKGFLFSKDANSLVVCGKLCGGAYSLRGDVSSQFITGLIFALVFLSENSSIKITPPFESRPYVELTIEALNSFGAKVKFSGEYEIIIQKSNMHEYSGKIEGDYSNAAFLDAFNHIGSNVQIENLRADSLQGDKIYREYFAKISSGTPTLDISDCPDLAPILFSLAALKNGAVFTGTDRLRIKESDRGAAMHSELQKLGGGLIFGNNTITVPQQTLRYDGKTLDSHNDHRIVMAMSVILSKLGGELDGIEAVRKSYPSFFENIKQLGAKVELK